MLPCDRLQGGELEAEPEGHLPVLRVERFGRDQEAQGTGGGPIHPPALPSPPLLGPAVPGTRSWGWEAAVGAPAARHGHGAGAARRHLPRAPPSPSPGPFRSAAAAAPRRCGALFPEHGGGCGGRGGRGEPRGDGHGPARGGALCRREGWGKEAQWLGEAGGSRGGHFWCLFVYVYLYVYVFFFSLKIGGHPVAKWDSWWGWGGGEEEELRAQGTEGG